MKLLLSPSLPEEPIVPDGYELIDGQLVETQMGAQASLISGKLVCLLTNHCSSPALGWVFPPDTSYQLLRDRPKLVRKPDVSFVRPGRLPDEQPPLGHIRLAPDLAVEVISPNDLYYEVEVKIGEYRSAGV